MICKISHILQCEMGWPIIYLIIHAKNEHKQCEWSEECSFWGVFTELCSLCTFVYACYNFIKSFLKDGVVYINWYGKLQSILLGKLSSEKKKNYLITVLSLFIKIYCLYTFCRKEFWEGVNKISAGVISEWHKWEGGSFSPHIGLLFKFIQQIWKSYMIDIHET